jgi:glycosyltransferase involved in cell wall biosynthesis
MRRIDRKGLRAPALVLDLELAPDGQPGDDMIAVGGYETLWCLSRVRGVPREVSFWDVTGDTAVSVRELRDRLGDTPAAGSATTPRSLRPRTAATEMTVVICTRDRPAGLRSTLASLRRQDDPEFGVLVVDNSPGSPAVAAALGELGPLRRQCVVEPRPGLAWARNRALGAVRTEVVAWIDDDEIADPGWVGRLKLGFAHEAAPAAVCGMMLPAELDTEAQVRFEQYGGFNKGRGMTPEVLRTGAPSVTSPLYPLPPFGAGGNMAFRTDALRAAGGFDPCLGAGRRTRGGEETRVLALLLSAGQVVLHWPSAITWHTHRREMAALRKQLYGYSAGLSAFYASMIRSRPAAAFDILRLAPYAWRDLRNRSDSLRVGELPEDFPACLLKAARRGLLEGPFMYLYEAAANGRQPRRYTASLREDDEMPDQPDKQDVS